MMMMMKVDDDGDGDGDNDGERLRWWLLSNGDESYISQRSDVLWRFACGNVFTYMYFYILYFSIFEQEN